jgi:hypothetical protein
MVGGEPGARVANKGLTLEKLLLCSKPVTDFTNPMNSAWSRTKATFHVAAERASGGDVQERKLWQAVK